jgi:hypothetical protein
LPANQLYAGEHWQVARRLARNALLDDGKNELWVCSAGYGLIPSYAQISPYSATFADGSPDSVPKGLKGDSEWWSELAAWNGPVAAVRSLAALVADDPRARVILVLSASYVHACRGDIDSAIAEARSEKLSIISAGTRSDAELAPYLLPVDSRLQNEFGGSRQALNIRTFEYLIRSGAIGHAQMHSLLAELIEQQPPIPRFERNRTSDTKIVAFIRSRLRLNPNATHTQLLREFRNANNASEQGRFAELFRSVIVGTP